MQQGDFIKIAYVGRIESGEIFDLTDGEIAKKEGVYNPKINYKPLPVIVGAGFLIPGMDKALLEMKVGENKDIIIKPEDAFGHRNPEMVRVVPRKAFGNKEPVQGMVVDFSGLKGRIQSVSAGRVMVDFNNPLAGKTLKYNLEVKEKIDVWEAQVKAIFEFFGIDKLQTKLEGNTVDIETTKLPVEIKEKIAALIIDHVSPGKIEKVRFIETYEHKHDEKKEEKK